ncbi:MAG: lytic transglycosylase domain-containing protein [Thermodesulfobacteriota bacterium]
MINTLFRIAGPGLAIGMLMSSITASAIAEDADTLYMRFLTQQMMIAKIQELNHEPAAESLKATLAAEARTAGMAIPEWFYSKSQKDCEDDSSDQTIASAQQPRTGIDQHIENASKEYGVNPALIKAVIRAESGFDPSAVSHAGAKGLMQIMDSTGSENGLTDPFDPKENIHCGTRLLKKYLTKYQALDKALIAYNAGEKYIHQPYAKLPAETQNYIPKVIQYYRDYAPEYEEGKEKLAKIARQ